MPRCRHIISYLLSRQKRVPTPASMLRAARLPFLSGPYGASPASTPPPLSVADR